MTSTLTELDLTDAAHQLASSGRGRKALRALLDWLDDSGLGLDDNNQQAALTLLEAAWGEFPGTARDIMRAELGV